MTPQETAGLAAAGVVLDLLTSGGLIRLASALGGSLRGYTIKKRMHVFEMRLEQLTQDFQSDRDRVSDTGSFDSEYLQTDEFQEIAAAAVGHALREMDEEKRAFYARLLANRCNTSIDHTWYPTALKLVQQIEPAHVAILRALRDRKILFPKDSDVSMRDLTLLLHLDDLEDFRPSLAAENSGFEHPFPDAAAWDAALGGAEPANTDAYRVVWAKFNEWRQDAIAHGWYLNSVGLVIQGDAHRLRMSELTEKLLEWLSVPDEGHD